MTATPHGDDVAWPSVVRQSQESADHVAPMNASTSRGDSTPEAVRPPAPCRPGPGSITWEINGERLAICGWSCAILLQVAHPLIAAGVARHSGFRASATAPAARLVHTIRAMLGLTYGSDDDARAVAARINAVHDRVRGGLPTATRAYAEGQTYSAHNPQLQAWVHLTMLDSVLRAYDLLVRPLTPDERDRYCAEARGATAWLRVPASALPAGWDEAQARIEAQLASPEIELSPEARALARDILWPRGGRWLGPIGAVHRLLTVGLLPPALRTAYDLPWSARDERRFQRVARLLRLARRLAPPALARWRAARRAERARLTWLPAWTRRALRV